MAFGLRDRVPDSALLHEEAACVKDLLKHACQCTAWDFTVKMLMRLTLSLLKCAHQVLTGSRECCRVAEGKGIKCYEVPTGLEVLWEPHGRQPLLAVRRGELWHRLRPCQVGILVLTQSASACNSMIHAAFHCACICTWYLPIRQAKSLCIGSVKLCMGST